MEGASGAAISKADIVERPEAVSVHDLHKNFGPLEVLKGVSMTAHEGDVVSMIGASGSGKSTFLRCINFLEMPTQGRHRRHRRGGQAPEGPADGNLGAGRSAASSSASAPSSAWCSRVSISGRT